MAEQMDNQTMQAILDGSATEAEGLLSDPMQVDQLLEQVKARVSDLPAEAAGALTRVPLMVQMIKGYITREYTDVSPKVVASVLGALLYLVKGRDIIPDSIPLIGLIDDIAVIALAIKLNESELDAFAEWQKDQPKVIDGIFGLTQD